MTATPAVPDEIRARRFVVVDEAGADRIVLDTANGVARIQLLSDGKPAVTLHGSVERGLGLFDREGRPRAAIGLGADGNPVVTLLHADGTEGIGASVTADGALLDVSSANGEAVGRARVASLKGAPSYNVTMPGSDEEVASFGMTKEFGPTLTFGTGSGKGRAVIGLDGDGRAMLALGGDNLGTLAVSRNDADLPVLSLSDADGRTRAAIGIAPDGSPNVMLSDANDRVRASVSLGADGMPAVMLRDRAGETRVILAVGADDAPEIAIGNPKAYRLRLLDAENGTASLTVFDAVGRPRSVLSVGNDGKPWVSFHNEKGEAVKSIDGSSWL